MAEVAQAVVLPSLLKRKTPSQLRGEQLKRRITVEQAHESTTFENLNLASSGTMKSEGPKSTRYTEKRLDELYPARKLTSKLNLLSRKTSFKETHVSKEGVGLKSSFSSNVTLKSHQDLNSKYEAVANAKDSISGHRQSLENDNQNKFRSVAELSLGFNKFPEQNSVDVDKAFKGLAAREASGSCSPPSSAGKLGDVKSTSLGNFCSEILIPGRNIPLDFTLKTAIRIVSSSPVDRLHRLIMCGTYNGMTPLSFQSGYFGQNNDSPTSKSPAVAEPCSLNSWIYPQSSLPASVISVLSSSNAVEMDFLVKRQLAWEDSFRSLYYMLRKSGCNIFYVCTSQFVVMFTATGGMGKEKRTCNAYISQSTRGFRSLLREHDISYSMPFCCSEVEQISREDLVELFEIEKQNLGQAKRTSWMPDVDSSPKSLLVLTGNGSVHGLYDFLLNYRSLLTMLSGMDVPVLCSPFPFLNAALSSPEVKCKEIKRVDALPSKEPTTKDGSIGNTKVGVCYSIELKGAFLPPWVVSYVCSAMSSEGKSFEASFTTELNSMGLNVALDVGEKSENNETRGDSQEAESTFGIPATVVTPDMRTACLKGLKYVDGSQVASLSPL
ncbi:hypothetical protein RND81_06G199300 [Saponaria officinalis]|uniref:Donson n=1 Tax=Saponaria officinalis TaxID=3572 RepID=A0AAW1KCT1_SAPOF